MMDEVPALWGDLVHIWPVLMVRTGMTGERRIGQDQGQEDAPSGNTARKWNG